MVRHFEVDADNLRVPPVKSFKVGVFPLNLKNRGKGTRFSACVRD